MKKQIRIVGAAKGLGEGVQRDRKRERRGDKERIS